MTAQAQSAPDVKHRNDTIPRLLACAEHPKVSLATAEKFRRWVALLEANPLRGLTSARHDALRDVERALGLAYARKGRPQAATPAAQAARAARELHLEGPPAELPPWLNGARPPTLRDAFGVRPFLRALAVILSWGEAVST